MSDIEFLIALIMCVAWYFAGYMNGLFTEPEEC